MRMSADHESLEFSDLGMPDLGSQMSQISGSQISDVSDLGFHGSSQTLPLVGSSRLLSCLTDYMGQALGFWLLV